MNDEKEVKPLMKELQEIRRFFADDLYATMVTGIVIEEAGEGYARVSLRVEDRHRNAMGQVMGAVYFTMADFAFAVASNCALEDGACVTHSCQINFVGIPKTDQLFATARAVKEGGRTNLYDVRVCDSEGNVVAAALSGGFKVKK